MRKSMRILLTLVALLLTLAMCFAVTGCSDKKKDKDDDDDDSKAIDRIDSPEDVVDAYMQASYVDFDIQALLDLYHQESLDMACEAEGKTIDDVKDDGKASVDEIKEVIEEDNIEVEWEIGDVRDVTYDDGYEIFDVYEEDFDIDVIEAKIVEVEFTARNEEDEKSDALEFIVVNIDDQWYMGEFSKIGL